MKINDSRELFAGGEKALQTDMPIIVADNIRTPENIGNLIRLAANAGARRIVSIETIPLKESKMRKTACMAWDYVELIHTSDGDFRRFIPENYAWVALETTPKSENIFTTRLPRCMALFVGNEVHGIRQELLDECPLHVNIPMLGQATSMNVSHAAAVALFEWVRQAGAGTAG